MKSRQWQGVAAAGLVAIIATVVLISRSSLLRVAPGHLEPSPSPTAQVASATPRLPMATPTLLALLPTAPAATPTETPLTPSDDVMPKSQETIEPQPVEDRRVLLKSEGGDDQIPASEPEATFTPSPTVTLEPVATSTSQPRIIPTDTATPFPTPVATDTPVPPPPPPSPTATRTPTATPTASATATVTATATATASRTPTPTPTIAAPFAFQVLPSGDFQIYRNGVAQIAGSPPASGIKLYLDGQEFHSPAGAHLTSGALLTVSGQTQLGENANITVFSGGSGLVVTQTITYTTGTDFFSLRWDISSPARADARFFFALDSMLDGSDVGIPYYNAATGEVGLWNSALHTRFMGLKPVLPAPYAHTVGPVGGPNGWAAVEMSQLKSFAGSGLDNHLVGLQWNGRIRSDAPWSIEAKLTFAPPE